MKKIVSLYIVFFFSANIIAQQIGEFSMSPVYNEYNFNPAAAGLQENPVLNVQFAKIYDQIPSSPILGSVTMNSRLKNGTSAIGAKVMHQRFNYSGITAASLSYTQRFIFNDKKDVFLNLGVSAGFINRYINFTGSNVISSDPQLLQNNGSTFNIDLGFGAVFKAKGFMLHSSVQQLPGINSKIISNGSTSISNFQMNPNYFFGAKQTFKLGKLKKLSTLEPSVVMNYTKGLDPINDIYLSYYYNDMFGFFSGFRFVGFDKYRTNSLALGGSWKIEKRVQIAYCFRTFVQDDFNSALGNTHEMMLSYHFNKNVKKR
jgi:type IX secretion system PorP/SprF family membrane protein